MNRVKHSALHSCIAVAVLVVLPGGAAARTWHVPADAPTIQAGIDSAGAGDDVLVAAGQYFEHDVMLKPMVLVHSVQGPSVTILDAMNEGAGFVASNIEQGATLQGLTIRNGRAAGTAPSGGGVRCVGSRLIVRDCVISTCSANAGGGGIFASESDVMIEDCRVDGCSAASGAGIFALSSTMTIRYCEVLNNQDGGGIVVEGPSLEITGCVISRNSASWWGTGGISVQVAQLTIQDCIVVHNSTALMGMATGLSVIGCTGSITNCTVASNTGWSGTPAVFVIYSPDIVIERTIVVFNRGDALFCPDSNIGLGCCNIYGNTGGNDICGTDLGGNFSADPLFCDAPNGDYTLDADSPCLPGNHPQGVDCGLIGARGPGCGAPPPTGACCFADGSCFITEPQGCEEQGGTYLGDGTVCVPNPCPPTPVTSTTWGRIKADYR